MTTKAFVEKWATGVLTFVSTGLILAAIKLWVDVNNLQNWRAEQWPLEKQLMLLEHQQIRATISVNSSNIEELENEVRDLR